MSGINAVTTNAPKGGVRYERVTVREDGPVGLSPIYTGICGTDRGMVLGHLDFSYNPDKQDFIVMGHESICRVTSADSKTGFREGDIVVPVVRRPGGCINCRTGRQDNCSDGKKHEAGITGMNGFMRESFTDSPEFLVKVKDPALARVGILTEPLKNVVKVFEVFETVSRRSIYFSEDSTYEGKNAYVIGTGAEGFLFSMMASEYGFNTSILNRHPIDENRLKICDAFGMDFVDSSKGIPDENVDLLIDTSGDPATLLNFIRRMNYNSIAVMFGTNGKAPPADFTGKDIDHIVERNISLVGSVDAAKVHYSRALSYLSRWNSMNAGALSSMITDEKKPSDVSVFTERNPESIKIALDWS
ncbi:MAG: glucose 1-dehydrogenase [Candidatus Thermoplasmatota archaeon]|nr:glucose 1-dehydrogenase [Candidatus Thermoplasmatota archaeon]MCL5785570.1 glucose 1-dehydrogenase [Candidatus Thermoplasmatota archaeon]